MVNPLPKCIDEPDRSREPCSRPRKLCPNCGAETPPAKRGAAKIFCDAKCRNKFHARNAARGKVLIPFVLAWVEKWSKDPDSAAAFRELSSIAIQFRDEDRAAGRPPMIDYTSKILSLGRHMDRRR